MTIAADPLFMLLPHEGSSAEALERFIADVLHQAGEWDTPRTSDGISAWRVVERGPARVRLAGRIHEISQAVSSFWLDIERDGEQPEQVHWTLYFDVVPGPRSPRRVDVAADLIDAPEQAEWRVTLMSTATVQDAVLVAGQPRRVT
ncbi:MAG TPA: hypothetical protein VEU33_38995 [Archangium sp.]|nr:hypothetical protein [Archangium sp.]